MNQRMQRQRMILVRFSQSDWTNFYKTAEKTVMIKERNP